MGFAKEFKDFAMKGNLVDLAVGFVMGVTFTKVTTAFIQGMIMPLIGLVQGQDMVNWVIVIKEAAVAADGTIITEAITIKYGYFIGVAIEFIIVAFFMFLVVKSINRMKKKKEGTPTPPAAPSKEEVLLTEIRDVLKTK